MNITSKQVNLDRTFTVQAAEELLDAAAIEPLSVRGANGWLTFAHDNGIKYRLDNNTLRDALGLLARRSARLRLHNCGTKTRNELCDWAREVLSSSTAAPQGLGMWGCI